MGQQEALINSIIHLLPHYIFWKDRNSVFLGCNEIFAKSAGLSSPEEIVGKTDYDLPWSKADSDKYRADDREVIESGISKINIEETQAFPDGTKLTLLTSKVPLINSQNKIVGVACIYTDITEKKQKEIELEKAKHVAIASSQSKTTFLSIASHEIKGPLSNSIYVLKKLEKTIQEDPTKTTNLLQLIRDQIKDSMRGVDTINYLLDFLNLDLTTDSLKEPEEVPFASRLVQLINPFEEKNTNIEFSLNYDKEIPKVIFIAKGLEEIIKILVANAVKYSKKNAFINIKVLDCVKDDKNYLKISVEDNGIGIHKSALDRFFAPLLFEGMKDGERIYSAPAIKLSYAKKFIESLGGEFTIESEPDVGTTVTMTVPYAKSSTDYSKFIPDSFERYKRKEMEIPLRKLHFLIVEDNPLTLQLLEDEITKLGHHVDAVPNAHEALKKAKEQDYEVAFLDISLPGMDGVELKQKLTRKGGDFPIVIAITSHDSAQDKNYFFDKGFVTVISKPFTRGDILACVETIQRVLVDLSSQDNESR